MVSQDLWNLRLGLDVGDDLYLASGSPTSLKCLYRGPLPGQIATLAIFSRLSVPQKTDLTIGEITR